ncbi:MAG: pyrroloquinoline quinone biosynthesis peptide chaperone PqqD, partial [Methyloligellaceae bacterium]
MADAGPRQRVMIEPESRPALPRHVKLRHDAGRDRWVILAPERILTPDEIAVEILR